MAKKYDLPIQDPAEAEHSDEKRVVTLPSGGSLWVYEQEVAWVEDRVGRYRTELAFTNVTDQADLDTVVTLELLCWRVGNWLSRQVDYWDVPINEDALQRQLNNTSKEVRELKKQLGIDKVSRDKMRGDDSFEKWFARMRTRAAEFGVHRVNQLTMALQLFNELKAKIILYDNTEPDERKELACDIPDIINWIRSDAIPRFDALDEHFRKEKATYWVRDV